MIGISVIYLCDNFCYLHFYVSSQLEIEVTKLIQDFFGGWRDVDLQGWKTQNKNIWNWLTWPRGKVQTVIKPVLLSRNNADEAEMWAGQAARFNASSGLCAVSAINYLPDEAQYRKSLCRWSIRLIICCRRTDTASRVRAVYRQNNRTETVQSAGTENQLKITFSP